MRFKYSLRELLGLVVFVAVACGSLLDASPWTASVVFTLTLAILLLGLLAAIGRKGSVRAFWLGFTITGWGYLWLAISPRQLPDEGLYGLAPSGLFQSGGTLVTTKLLRLGHAAIHPPKPNAPKPNAGMGGMGGGFFSLAPDSLQEEIDSFARIGGFGDDIIFHAFMRIGHSLWALLFAYLGGRLTRYFHDTAAPSVTSPRSGG